MARKYTSGVNLTLAEREAGVNRSLVWANEALKRYESGKPDLALALAQEAVSIEDPPAEALRALSTVALGMGTRAILRGQGYIRSLRWLSTRTLH